MRCAGRQETTSRIPETACVVQRFAPTAVAQAACGEWNARAFFKKAAALAVTRCLARFGAEVNVLDDGERKPLRIVAPLLKTPSVVTASLDAGADPNVTGAEGKIL